MPSILRRRTREFSTKQDAALASRLLSSNNFDTKARTFLENALQVPLNRFTDLDSYIQVGSSKVWATFRACHLVASLVMSTDFDLALDGDVKWEPKPDSLEAKTLRQPNPFDSWKEMMYLWVYHMKLCGCAYWMKDEVNGQGQPLHIYPLLPQFMQIIPDRVKNVGGYIYRVNGRDMRLAPEEVIYFRRPHPGSLLKGMGDIEPSESLYNDFINRSTYQEKFIERGAQPSGILTLKETLADENEWGKLKKWWEREYGGKENAGKTAFLTGEWSYQQLGLTQQQMQSIEQQKASIEHIFMNHGVPLSIAGVQGAANYATARVDEMNFRKYEIVPLLDLFIDKVNGTGQLYRLFDPGMELRYSLSGLIDVEQVVKDYLPLVKAGAMTPNELREKAGEDRVEGNPYMDQYFVGRDMIPLEMAGLSEAPSTAPSTDGTGNV